MQKAKGETKNKGFEVLIPLGTSFLGPEMELNWTLNFSNPNMSTNLFICSGDLPEKDM